MSRFKERHTCERCGNQWQTRTGAFYDEMVEWIHHIDDRALAKLNEAWRKKYQALELELHRMTFTVNEYALAEATEILANVQIESEQVGDPFA